VTLTEMGVLLAKVQLGDNRDVDELVLAYWHELIGDMTFEEANLALRRFRRERPGVYLEPGHLLELAGIVDEPLVPDIQSELEAGWAAEVAPLGDPVEQLAAMPWAKPFEAEGI
jgi:hypothetical protein